MGTAAERGVLSVARADPQSGSPPDKGSLTQLFDVTVLGPRNAWAVGYYVPTGGGHTRTLVEHWNGTRWTIVPSPNPISGSDNFLKGGDAVSASNIWAVGSNGRPGTRRSSSTGTGRVGRRQGCLRAERR
jgi:hypothetical protein